MPTLALVRHGQSLWNHENRFTGFVDVPLTEQGRGEARKAADALKGLKFDVAYTSALTRAQETLAILLDTLGQRPPVIRDAALNERHYGDLQGLNKADAAKEFGEKQVHIWRRSFDVPPPNGESLEMTAKRVLPFYDRAIAGDLRQGKNVLVVAHGNSNRSLVMRLDKLSGETVVGLELATGVPLVYEIGADGQVVSKRGGTP
ncbi:2,3-bisphosphoglycerate-dependent phosphoglycerate mutase [Corallococcus carmarthensis]|uniref:2,3-bisphosphoglycerate-dependent phosphoglycerate mutase n=1 Tax=Corallococcus carmarthensis TaxID=2316728 RepID=A0A3A8JL40_9BACT|nr:2,3-diphosphoglycerate-dependent phosphoglycerate mutase [Corallococcus carmarthensis]NOK22361.1 2,3-diphosphoglycerate-dependent phosphoglycerate mutase [Corallococcus carmarthensis]RKG92530.1 2,3-diphosphoglycerate-dependent phosphoglycerate mutase [Corallococcus carmarthensis]